MTVAHGQCEAVAMGIDVRWILLSAVGAVCLQGLNLFDCVLGVVQIGIT